jgi:Mg-chelatase subunit ChlD
VEAFRHWLTEPAGQARLGALGFDPDRRECSTLERSRCVPPNLDAVLDVYRRSKLPGRVLLALDASGSMSAHTTGGKTRFQIAAEGVAQALGQAGLRDEVGLWTFPDASDRGSKELVKVREGTPQQRTDIVAGLNGVMPKGSTPLYPTVLAGLTAVAGGPTDSQARALVVLTDGEDTTGGRLGDVEKQVGQIASSTGVRLYIIATGDANCDATDGSGLRRLTTAGNGRCLRTGAEGVSAIMADLFGTLWSGR